MRKLLLICLLATCLLSAPTKKRDIQRVFAQVESLIKAGGPLDTVSTILGEFTSDAVAEQSAFDELQARATHECQGEFEYRARQVNEASSALKTASTALAGLVDQQNRATADLTFTNKVLGETETMIHILESSRHAEIESFAEYQENYEFNASQMEEVIELVEAVVSGHASFAQVTKHAHGMLRAASKNGQAEKLAPLMAMLAQVAAGESDNEFLEQLSNVVTRLRGEIEDEWQTVLADEEHDQAEYEQLRATTDAQHAQLTETQGTLEAQLAELNIAIVQETGAVAAATAKRDQHQRLWDEAAAYCETGDHLYAESTQERRDELDMIDNLRAKVTLRWGDF